MIFEDYNWAYFVLGIVSTRIYFMLAEIYKARRREDKFIKRVSVHYPDATIRVITVQSTDKKALEDLERQLREEPAIFHPGLRRSQSSSESYDDKDCQADR